ncbi:hypothetical protein HN011_007997 [Eciton burchellii]|nr:hypothetical protein HN011_007997 [Eciton burchellii]
MNKHDIQDIHGWMNQPFSRRNQGDSSAILHSAKMNIIAPIIPEFTRNIIDLMLVVTGASLNTLLALVIVLSRYMHTSANCYIMSLVFSNVLILIEPLKQVLHWSFSVKLEVNLDYTFLVSFSTSILTIILLNIETYVVVCRKDSALHKRLLKISMAVKCILYIWVICVIVTAMELHLYIHFEEEVTYHIYGAFTIMFLVLPCFIFVTLDFFIIYNLIISKLMDDAWPIEDTERFIFLVGITVGYLLTMIPYRIAKAIAFVTESCCSDTTIETVYTMLKMYPLILPITYFAMSKEFRQVIKRRRATCRA